MRAVMALWHGNDVDVVVTYNAPSFAHPYNTLGRAVWLAACCSAVVG